VICAENGLGRLLTWYTDKYDIDLAHVFYDQNESFIKSIRTRWHQHEARLRKTGVASDLVCGRIANVADVNMRTTAPVQAADMIACGFTRRLALPGSSWSEIGYRLNWRE